MTLTESRARATVEVQPPVRIELTTYRPQGGCCKGFIFMNAEHGPTIAMGQPFWAPYPN